SRAVSSSGWTIPFQIFFLALLFSSCVVSISCGPHSNCFKESGILNIWIFNHYADSPDRPTTRSYDLGKQLVERGHQVTIFAAGFSHYNFKEQRLKPGEKSREENWNGVRFVWLKTFPYRRNNWRRVLNMLTYGWRAFLTGRAMRQKPDVVIGTSVHPLAAFAACMVARKRRARFFFEVTDLWPETLIEFGMLRRSGLPARCLRALEKFLY